MEDFPGVGRDVNADSIGGVKRTFGIKPGRADESADHTGRLADDVFRPAQSFDGYHDHPSGYSSQRRAQS